MATVGRTTATGGREWAAHPGLGPAFAFNLPTAGSLNFLRIYLREQNAANANDAVAGVCTAAGVLVATSAILENAVNSTATFAQYDLLFADEVLASGDYVGFIVGSGTNGSIIAQGQTDVSGVVSYVSFDPAITFPTLPADMTNPPAADLKSDALRSWDMYIDYDPITVASLSAATPSGTIGTATTATIGATTDQATGTFYVVVDTSGNLAGVTAAQIKAGQNAGGGAAFKSGDTPVGSTTPSVGVTGLVASTSYAYAAIQNNANGDSNIVTGTFTTASGSATSSPGSGGSRSRVATLMLS